MKNTNSPIQQQVRVINMGIDSFSEDLRKAEVPVIQMDWRPPAGGDRKLIALLDGLADDE
jgi:hypothetical protein